MRSTDLTALITLANEKVLAHTGKPLTDVQIRILEQVLDGQRLKDIQVVGYSETTVQRDFCPKLWKLLAQALQRDVRINTIRLALEEGLRQTPGITAASATSAVSAASLAPQPPLSRSIPNNLPTPSYTAFIGRQEELSRLLDLLSPGHAAPIISIDGIGGVGKTSLVVEAARRCLAVSCSGQSDPIIPSFDLILFTSAKEFYLTPLGFLKSLLPRRTLNDMFQQIARVIEELDITGASFEEQIDLIRDALAKYRTLLIVDNLETVQDQQDVLAFLYELPPSVKVVITTREQILFVPVRLTSMSEADGLCLIEHEIQLKGVSLPPDDRLALYRATGGIPVAISYAVGQLANGYPMREVLQVISQSTGDVARFCFESSVRPLQGKPAHRLLMALAFFPASAQQAALIQVAIPAANPDISQPELVRLRGLSLIRQETDRYSMLPLTREYALAELKAHPDFTQEARDRWLHWYLNFSKTYQAQDPSEWYGQQFEQLELEWQNLQSVMEWCMSQGHYSEALQLWKNILKTYTQIQGRHVSRIGFWNDRLIWSTWLMQMAEQQGDWPTATEIMLDRAWTLITIGKPNHLQVADRLLNQAWDWRHHQTFPFQANLAKTRAILAIQRSEFAAAQTWIMEATTLLEQAQLPESEHLRQAIQLQYYQGELWFKIGDYPQAKQCFETALEQAQPLNSTRTTAIIQNWLADIAIEQGDFQKAHTLLMEGLRLAEMNHDCTRMAYCQRSIALLHQVQQDCEQAVRWATSALEQFEALNMIPEVEETQSLLERISGAH